MAASGSKTLIDFSSLSPSAKLLLLPVLAKVIGWTKAVLLLYANKGTKK